MSFGEALKGGNLSLSAPGSAMRGSSTVRVINNNEKLGLPWICYSIYNVHLSPSPRPAQQPREIRAPFSASAWGGIFNRDAVAAGGTAGAEFSVCWVPGPMPEPQRTGFLCCLTQTRALRTAAASEKETR